MEITPAVLRCLVRLQSEEMRPLLAWLQTLDTQTKTALVHASAERVALLQGEARFLSRFIESVGRAQSLLDDMERGNPQ